MNLSFDYQDFMIFFTFLLLWTSIQFGQLVEDSIAYILVLSLGIIHGANDLLILKKRVNKQRFIQSVFGYILLILACIISFFFDPFLSMILFVLISGYHFGEEHFEKKIEGPLLFKSLIYILYGLIIFLLIFMENQAEVDSIMYDLTGKSFSPKLISTSLGISITILLLLFLFGYIKKHLKRLQMVREVFYVLLLYLVFKTSSLILGFAIYFIFWHSIPSIIGQTKYLFGNTNKMSVIEYFKTAGIIWLFSIGFLISIYYAVDKQLFSSIIFLVLFAITAPHVWVMYRMKKK